MKSLHEVTIDRKMIRAVARFRAAGIKPTHDELMDCVLQMPLSPGETEQIARLGVQAIISGRAFPARLRRRRPPGRASVENNRGGRPGSPRLTMTFVTKKVTKSGRPPLKRKAMTAAERQRRHRKKIAGRSRAEGGDELHETPACAVHALLEAEALPQVLWEPACGYGAIVRILRAAGRTVIASDLRAYDTPDLDFVQDFLTTTAAPDGVQAVVMNPPFSKAAALRPARVDAGHPDGGRAAAAGLAGIDHEATAWTSSRAVISPGSTCSASVCRRCTASAGRDRKPRPTRDTPGSCSTSGIAARRRCIGSEAAG